MQKIAILLCLCGSLLAQTNFKIEQVIQGSVKAEELDPKKMNAKVTLVDIWATWCGPCIANISEWNKLYDDHKSKGVEFIALSDENADKVKTFLSKREYKGIQAIDADGSVLKAFEINSRPSTLVFDAQGNYKGKIYPALIKDSLMSKWLVGDFSFFNKVEKSETKLDVGRFYAGHDPIVNAYTNMEKPKRTYQVIVRPSPISQLRGSYAYTETEFSFCGGSIKKLYAMLFDLPSGNWVNQIKMDTSTYDVIYNNPFINSQDTMWQEVITLANRFFKIKPELKKQKQKIVFISGSNAKLKKTGDLDIKKNPEEKLFKPIIDLLPLCEKYCDKKFMLDENLKAYAIDTYELGTKLWRMNAQEIEVWLTGKGFTFTEKEMEVEILELN